MNIAVIGDGGWGTALAVILARKGYDCTLWGYFPSYLKVLKRKRENVKFLPGVSLPSRITITNDMECVLRDAHLVVLAVPSQYMRNVLRKIKKCKRTEMNFLSVAKGLECSTTHCMSDVIRSELGKVKLAVLSGPNIANEVALGMPSAAVCASDSKKLSLHIQDIFMMPSFRIYTSNDVIGVELAGALKNIIAIACGISDGLGFGTNTKAALLTRGLAEIARLGVAIGARSETLSGLAGIGYLVTTCMSPKSRNRWFGEQLGSGAQYKTVIKKTEMVVEGINTTKSALKIAKRFKVSMPITAEVYKVIFRNKKAVSALYSLMLRQKKPES